MKRLIVVYFILKLNRSEGEMTQLKGWEEEKEI